MELTLDMFASCRHRETRSNLLKRASQLDCHVAVARRNEATPIDLRSSKYHSVITSLFIPIL